MINIKLFEKVKAHILEEPKRLHQELWLTKEGQWDYASTIKEGTGAPPCGTVACVAGWAVELSGYLHDDLTYRGSIKTHAMDLLLGKGASWDLRDSLEDDVFMFFPDSKPGTTEYAQEVVAVIDEFIANAE